MLSLLKKIPQARTWLLDMMFPISCIACNKEGFWICPDCLRGIKPTEKNVCPVCEKNITPDGRTCFSCKKSSPLDGLVVSCSYKNEIASRAVHLYKYRFISDLHLPLGSLMTKTLRSTDIPLCDLLVPVPLHKKRLRWRGFNQAELLAQYISKNLLPTELELSKDLLIRSKNTKAQMKIKKHRQRFANIKDAFRVTNKKIVAGKTVLLVDDVATTGSTLFECAKVLKNSGASEVFAIVVARQEIKKS